MGWGAGLAGQRRGCPGCLHPGAALARWQHGRLWRAGGGFGGILRDSGISNEIELKKQVEVSKALEAQNEDLQEQLNSKAQELDLMEEKLQGMLAKLQETKGKLKKSVELNVKLKEGFEMLTKKAGEINLLNARLLYTNKTLGNSSLNERQKNQIAESISRASSVEEAKTIYSTLLKSTASVSEKRTAPQSLTEALNKSPSPFLPRKQTQIDPTMDRWKTLAGIKK